MALLSRIRILKGSLKYLRFNMKPKVKLSRYFLPPGVQEVDGRLYFNHKIDIDYKNWRHAFIQLRASGIQKSTVVQIIAYKCEVTQNQINAFLTDFVTVWTFRPMGDTLKRAKGFMDFKKSHLGIIGQSESYKPDAESFGCVNFPLVNIRHRFNKKNPLTKVEKDLLYEIRHRGMHDGSYNFFGDLYSGR